MIRSHDCNGTVSRDEDCSTVPVVSLNEARPSTTDGLAMGVVYVDDIYVSMDKVKRSGSDVT